MKAAMLSAALVGLAGAVVFHPPLLALVTWDGRMESLPGPIVLWHALSLALLSFGLAVAFVWGFSAGRLGGRPGRPARKTVALIALGTIVIGVAAAACFAAIRARHNSVDILSALKADHALSEDARRAARQEGKAQALDRIADYFRSRPAPGLVKPPQLWLSGEELRRQARAILAGGFPGFPDFTWRPGESIDWRCGPRSRRKRLLFELQGQRFIFSLLDEVKDVPETRRIELASAFVEEWRRANPVWPNANRYAWNDDAAANRIQAHIHLMERARALGATSRNDEVAFLKSLIQHAEKLMDPDAYNAKTNHGMMQNCALLSIALAYPEFDRGGRWRETAVKRMEDYLLRYAVSPEGVFLELTPEYHFLATVQALWFYTSCRQAGIELDPWFAAVLRKMLVFCREILQPDRSLPMMADTRGEVPKVSGWPWERLPAWGELSQLRLALTAADVPPNVPCAKLWRRSGYFLLRAPTSEWTTSSAMMLTFKAAPQSHAHGHRDALSVTLFANGRPLLSGPGYPPYDEKRKARIATTAQNTVSVDGKSHRSGRAEVVFLDTRFAGASGASGPVLAVIQGRSRLYDGVTHVRTVVHGPASRAVLIVDQLDSPARHDYRQHFRLARGLSGRNIAGTLRAGAGAGQPSGPLLKIAAWQAGASAPVPLPCRLSGQVAEFLITGRSATFIALLDFSGAARPGSLRICENSFEWRGDRGSLRSALPIVSRDSYEWSPRASGEAEVSKHVSTAQNQ